MVKKWFPLGTKVILPVLYGWKNNKHLKVRKKEYKSQERKNLGTWKTSQTLKTNVLFTVINILESCNTLLLLKHSIFFYVYAESWKADNVTNVVNNSTRMTNQWISSIKFNLFGKALFESKMKGNNFFAPLVGKSIKRRSSNHRYNSIY